jgi:hypothetical protein
MNQEQRDSLQGAHSILRFLIKTLENEVGINESFPVTIELLEATTTIEKLLEAQ